MPKKTLTITVRFWRVINLAPYFMIVLMRVGRQWSVILGFMNHSTIIRLW